MAENKVVVFTSIVLILMQEYDDFD